MSFVNGFAAINKERYQKVSKRLILAVVLTLVFISFLLVLGNNFSAPDPGVPTANLVTSSFGFPKGASDVNFTVLCVKKADTKIQFTSTGPYVTCPPDYATVPVQLDPKLIKK